ncbi:MAG: hypothetical protein WBG92_03725 [Thiohalocapsa sp.]
MKDNVVDFRDAQHPIPDASGGEPPDMEQRLRNLEQSVAVIASNYATKADVGDLRTEMHKGFGDLRAEMHTSLSKNNWQMITALFAITSIGVGVVITALRWMLPAG